MLATADDMRARFTEDALVQLTGQAEWNAQVIAALGVKIKTASAIAEGFVAKYYAPAPGRPIPELLTELVCDMAFARMHLDPGEVLLGREKMALAQLEQISKGLIKIDGGDQDIPARTGAVIVPDRPRTFSRDSLGNF